MLQHGSIEQQGKAIDLYFKPKSIFAAKFFGHTNLYAIHHSTHTSTWITPWGEHPLNIVEEKPEVVLVVPEECAALGDGPYEGLITSIQFLGGMSRIEIESQGQTLVSKIQSQKALNLKKDLRVKFNILWADCFEIGCL